MELRDYVAVLRRKRWAIGLAAVMVAGTALVVSLLESPVYQANVRLLLEPTQTVFDSTGQSSLVNVQTEIERLQSQTVQDEVRRRVGAAPRVSAIQIGTTQVMQVTAKASTPGRAADFANAYADAYIAYRVQQAADQLEKAAVPLQEKVDNIEKQIAPLQDQIQALPPGPQRDAKNAELGPRIKSLLDVESTFKSTLDKLQVDAALKSGGVQLVAPAAARSRPVRPTPVRNTLMGLAVGLLAGVGLAFLFENLDDSINTQDDLAQVAGDVTVLTVIPEVPGWKNRAEARLVSKTQPTSPAAEAYRSLRTSIQFMGIERKLHVLQVTSPNASEGKTTTLANLAIALTQAGQSVAILSCDLRRPRIHEYFGIPNDVGFTSVLLGETGLSTALQRVPGIPRLVVLASGPLPPNPSELLSSRRTTELFTALRSQLDIILVDSPPVLPVTDAAVLAPRVDGTLLVAMAGQTTTKQLARSMELLRKFDATLIGAVLNGATESAYGYGYGYGSYTSQPAAGNGKKATKAARSEEATTETGSEEAAVKP